MTRDPLGDRSRDAHLVEAVLRDRPAVDPARADRIHELAPKLRAFAARVLGVPADHPDAEDCAQETLTRWCAQQSEGRANDPPGFVFGSARNVALDLVRRRARRRENLEARTDSTSDLGKVASEAASPEDRREAQGERERELGGGAIPRADARFLGAGRGDRGCPGNVVVASGGEGVSVGVEEIMKATRSWMVGCLAGAWIGLVSATASAEVTFEGSFPDDAGKISVHLADAAPSVAVREVAKKAGWSVVVRGDIDRGRRVSLDIEEASPKDVLQSILDDGSFVLQRSGEGGKILEVAAKDASPAPAQAASPAPGNAAEAEGKAARPRGSDRHLFGQSLRIEKGETVEDVSVTGGSVDVYGTVDGDLVVTGGTATIHEGGHVTGDVRAIGGAARVEKGGRVDGDAKVIGGVFWADDGAIVAGDVSQTTSKDASSDKAAHVTAGQRWSGNIGRMLSNFAFLFVLGALFLAGAPERMMRLRAAVAGGPVRSMAHGLLGTVAFVVAMVALAITVIGIPFALVIALVGAFAFVGALGAALTTVGAAAFGHRSQNVYVHLAIGSALFALVGLIPWVGTWVQLATMLAAIGALVTTRLAGFWQRKRADAPSA